MVNLAKISEIKKKNDLTRILIFFFWIRQFVNHAKTSKTDKKST